MKKPNIDYPCDWTYKIIGLDQKIIEETISSCFTGIQYSLRISNQSRTGKYTSLNFTVTVESEEKRNEIFNQIKNIPTVHIVL